ncbi:MAG: ATP-binding protein [Candidatus Neomarinimicrobiota bacterium]
MNSKVYRLLVVEDEASHLELISHAFRDHNRRFNISAAGTLKQARANLVATQPDLLLVDLFLPDGRGIDLIPATTADQQYPVVVMTGFGDEKMAVEAMKAGALDYIVKSTDTLSDLPHLAERALREWEHIVARRTAEQELRESEKRYRTLIELSPDSIAIHDGQTVLFANSASAKLLRVSDPSKLIGSPVIDMLDPEYREKVGQRVKWMLETGAVVEPMEQKFLRSDGTSVDVEVAACGINSHGCPAVLVIARDITERKEAQTQIAEASKMAAVGRLAAGIAHEINNPLSNILGYAQLLLKEVEPEGQFHDDVKRIEVAAIRSGTIVNNLLAFSRPARLEHAPCDLSQLVPDSFSQLAPDCAAAKVDLAMQVEPGLPMVPLDTMQIQQVLINLGRNAIQAMPDGGKLSVEVRSEPNTEDIYIMVSDTGHGIPPQDLPRVFEPFFTTKEVGLGTGLGLSLSYGFVEAHGGTIEAASTPGEGSVFTVVLPMDHKE